MWYKYDCYLNNEYVTKGIIYADTIEEAIKQARLKHNNKYDIVNIELIKNTIYN